MLKFAKKKKTADIIAKEPAEPKIRNCRSIGKIVICLREGQPCVDQQLRYNPEAVKGV